MNKKKLLITGANGMVGKNLCENEIISKTYDLLTPRSSELNLLNSTDTFDYLKEHMPDVVVHCAGRVGGIQANINAPTAFLFENYEMGKNLVMSCKHLGIKQLLNMASSCMYPRNAENPLKEELVLKGELEPTNEGYALAKISVAKLCEYISREDPTFLYKTLIPCNLYGRHDKFDPTVSHMIPAVIRKVHLAKENNEENVEIWGTGEARREFMLASDLADFTASALQRLESLPQYLNVGLGFDYTINEYYKVIAQVIGYTGKFTHDTTKPAGMKQKLISTEKLEQFNWKAMTSLIDGIKVTYQYFLNEVKK